MGGSQIPAQEGAYAHREAEWHADDAGQQEGAKHPSGRDEDVAPQRRTGEPLSPDHDELLENGLGRWHEKRFHPPHRRDEPPDKEQDGDRSQA